ncbi:Monoacylglycerol lipase abhd12 [Rhizophlyctis rosea]|nr:Monoacylglycerol lipase abhd12 [Rhizophlyctis rosea]
MPKPNQPSATGSKAGPKSRLQRIAARTTRLFIYFLTFYLSILSILITFPTLFQPYIIYLHWIRFPFNVNWTDGGEDFGFRSGGLRTIQIPTADNLTLGGWHVLPRNLVPPVIADTRKDYSDAFLFDEHLKTADRVFLYCHGNAGNRATGHRTAFYKIMSTTLKNSHVLTFDYRGFGDSSPTPPTERGLQIDALAAFKYLTSRSVPHTRIILVGHSLGSGVATWLARNLTESNTPPAGLILLSAYASVPDAALAYPMVPLLYPFQYLPVLSSHIKNYVAERWESVDNIKYTSCPILIIHGSKDFEILPWQARSLFIESVGERLGKSIEEPAEDKPAIFAPDHVGDVVVKYDGYSIRPLPGPEGWLWVSDKSERTDLMGGTKGDVWYLEVKRAGHNTLGKYQVVGDGIEAWVKEHSL